MWTMNLTYNACWKYLFELSLSLCLFVSLSLSHSLSLSLSLKPKRKGRASQRNHDIFFPVPISNNNLLYVDCSSYLCVSVCVCLFLCPSKLDSSNREEGSVCNPVLCQRGSYHFIATEKKEVGGGRRGRSEEKWLWSKEEMGGGRGIRKFAG